MAIIGIDLGTTNSLAAVWQDYGPVIIPNALEKNLTPSVVSILEDGTLLTGQAAKERLISDPNNTANVFKRTMGQRYFYELGGRGYSSTELSAMILKSLKRDAEKFLGQEVTEAVISVPAYFNQNQRKATKEAGKLAGLKVERLVSEPTAAALCYGVNANPDMKNAIVLDLGGGTFDVSVLEFFEGVIDVKAVSGDNRLGGEDFTKSIAAWFLYENNLGEDLFQEDVALISKKAEQVKYAVSDLEHPISAAMTVNIKDVEYSKTLTPEIFSVLTKDLMERFKVPIKKAIRDAGLTVSEIDSVILMGGATRMKCVRDFAERVFGDKVITSYNPDETVALGAAILGALKDHNKDLKETVLTDICPFTLSTDVLKPGINPFTEEAETVCDPIIERNSPVPISVVKRYYTAYLGQRQTEVSVYQGESLNPKENLFLGKLTCEVPVNTKSHECIDIRYTYDINGLLEVEVSVPSDGTKKSMVINQNNNDLSDVEIEEARKKMESLKILPWEDEENIAILERANRLYEETSGTQREYIAKLIVEFQSVLARQHPTEIAELKQKMLSVFDSFEDDIW